MLGNATVAAQVFVVDTYLEFQELSKVNTMQHVAFHTHLYTISSVLDVDASGSKKALIAPSGLSSRTYCSRSETVEKLQN